MTANPATSANSASSPDEVLRREIAHEQQFVDTVYVQLETSTRNAEALAREGHGRGRLGHEGGLVERDAMVFQAAKRIATLNAAHEGLVFGRLDLLDPAEAPRYVGRIGLRDRHRDTLLIDWRAPAAAVFYQATPAEPQGVVRRRVLRSSGRKVVGVEDDLLDAEAGTDLPIVGEGALMAQLSRARDRSMHSIVATIQAEQDRAIRAPARGVVSISGGPGTGKTVVALHRAAYLLYTDRARYERGGVLVVGPSGVFMRYIERVLPSLGETAVALRSLGEVVDGVRAVRHDDGPTADLKGSARMAEVVKRLVRRQVPGAPREFRIFFRDENLLLGQGDLRQLRRQLLSHGKHNRQLGRVADALIDALWAKVRGDRALDRGREDFGDTVRDDIDFLEFAHAWWPPLDATEVLGWLGDEELLAAVSEQLYSGQDQALLTKSWTSASLGDNVDWSIEDVALLDEIRYLIGDPPETQAEEDPLAWLVADELPELSTASERVFGNQRTTQRIEDDGYAHVLVDEAQDLSPMQWRMIGRRGTVATWTVVGDPAQSSWPTPAESAQAREAALSGKKRHDFHLSKNYRNSKEIYEYAAGYAERSGLEADLPEAVRETGIAPELRTVADLGDGLRASVADLLSQVPGTVGVVVPDWRRSSVESWLASWPECTDALEGDDNARLVVLTGLETKGLEFDGIVVVEPTEIETESSTGRATLYVVLTRATQRLILLARA